MPDPSPHEPGEADLDFARHRDYLTVLARSMIGPARAGEPGIDPSDVVQQALLRAHAHRADYRGSTPAEQAAWLRQILARQIIDASRKLGRRPEGRAVSIGRAIEDSSRRLDAWLADDGPSPSSRLRLEERRLRLAAALARLGDDQRTAIEQHYLRDKSVPELSLELDKTQAAVAGLIRRGLENLRLLLDESS